MRQGRGQMPCRVGKKAHFCDHCRLGEHSKNRLFGNNPRQVVKDYQVSKWVVMKEILMLNQV